MKRSFWEVGQWLQATAKTAEEAKERINSSCTKCNKAAMCNENICPIARAYKTRLEALKGENKGMVTYYTPRKYKKATPEVKTKKILLNYLTRLSKVCTSRKTMLL